MLPDNTIYIVPKGSQTPLAAARAVPMLYIEAIGSAARQYSLAVPNVLLANMFKTKAQERSFGKTKGYELSLEMAGDYEFLLPDGIRKSYLYLFLEERSLELFRESNSNPFPLINLPDATEIKLAIEKSANLKSRSGGTSSAKLFLNQITKYNKDDITEEQRAVFKDIKTNLERFNL